MLYNVIILKIPIFFYVIYNCLTMTITCDWCVTVMCDVILVLNFKFKIRKLNENENMKWNKNK